MRAIWSGSLSFGLINIPVKVYSASLERGLSFKLLEKQTLCPIGYTKVCKTNSNPRIFIRRTLSRSWRRMPKAKTPAKGQRAPVTTDVTDLMSILKESLEKSRMRETAGAKK